MEWVVGVVYAGFLAGSGVLAVIDARTKRLPDKVMFPLYGWGLLGLGLAGLLGHGWWRLGVALITSGLFFGLLWVLWFFGGMGRGDVKLMGTLGLYLGWVSLPLALAGVMLGMLIAALATVGGLLLGRIERKAKVAYGPYLILGAWAALAAQAVQLLRG